MVHNIETKLNYSLMNHMGHIYICSARTLPILSLKMYDDTSLLVFRPLCLLVPVF